MIESNWSIAHKNHYSFLEDWQHCSGTLAINGVQPIFLLVVLWDFEPDSYQAQFLGHENLGCLLVRFHHSIFFSPFSP